MTQIKVTVLLARDLPAHIDGMNREMREWTDQAARGECAWMCADCCCSDSKGMPDECFHGHASCTAVIQRDKRQAMSQGIEPS